MASSAGFLVPFLLLLGFLAGCARVPPNTADDSPLIGFKATYEGGNVTYRVALEPPEMIMDWDLSLRLAYPFTITRVTGVEPNQRVGWELVVWLDGGLHVARTDMWCDPPSGTADCEAVRISWNAREHPPPLGLGLPGTAAGPLAYRYLGMERTAQLSWRSEGGLQVAAITGGVWDGASWLLDWNFYEFGFGEFPIPMTVKADVDGFGVAPSYDLRLTEFNEGDPLVSIAPWPAWRAGGIPRSGYYLFPGEDEHYFTSDAPTPREAFEAMLDGEPQATENYDAGCAAAISQEIATETQLTGPVIVNVSTRYPFVATVVDREGRMKAWHFSMERTLAGPWRYVADPEATHDLSSVRACKDFIGSLAPVLDSRAALDVVDRLPMGRAGPWMRMTFGSIFATWPNAPMIGWGSHVYAVGFQGGSYPMAIDISVNSGLLASARIAPEDLALWDRGQIKAASN